MPPCSCARRRAKANRATASSTRSPAWTPDMARLDRKGASLARDHRRSPISVGDARAIERRRHDDEAQILAQPRLRVERERKTEIRVERALVEFVEDHRRDVGERRVVEDEAREDALGHDLDAGLAREARTEPHAQRRPSRRPLRRASCAMRLGGGARREPARLEEKDAAALRPRARREAPSGTRVVFPAPVGATITALARSRNAAQELRQALVDRERRSSFANGYRVRGAPGRGFACPSFPLIPAKAGIQAATRAKSAGPRLRGDERGQTPSAAA